MPLKATTGEVVGIYAAENGTGEVVGTSLVTINIKNN